MSEWTVIETGPLWDRVVNQWVYPGPVIIAVGVSQGEADRLVSVNPGHRISRPTTDTDKETAR